MMFPLFRRGARHDTISTLYGTFVAQARSPCIYREYAVTDTVNGRFDLRVLHLVAVLGRLAEDTGHRPGPFRAVLPGHGSQFTGKDIADLSVPKEIQRTGEAFYGRKQAYRAACGGTG
jgi:cytochrome b pre-mRNA-processing protein 3